MNGANRYLRSAAKLVFNLVNKFLSKNLTVGVKRSGVGVGRGVRGSGLLGGSQRDVLSSIPSTIYLVKWYIARSSSQVKKKKKNNLQVQNGYLLYQMSEPTRSLSLSLSLFYTSYLKFIACCGKGG